MGSNVFLQKDVLASEGRASFLLRVLEPRGDGRFSLSDAHPTSAASGSPP